MYEHIIAENIIRSIYVVPELFSYVVFKLLPHIIVFMKNIGEFKPDMQKMILTFTHVTVPLSNATIL